VAVEFRINVVVDPAGAVSGSKQVKSQLDSTAKAADNLAKSLNKASGGKFAAGASSTAGAVENLTNKLVRAAPVIREYKKNTESSSTASDKLNKKLSIAARILKKTGQGFKAAGVGAKNLGKRLLGAVGGLKRVETQAKKTTASVGGLRRTLLQAVGFVGISIAIRESIGLLAEFSQAMSTVKGVTGATEEQFQALTQEALLLGNTTRFTSTQAAEGMLFLARAGFTAEESLLAVSDTLLLAQSGALGLGSAADISSNVLAGFRLNVTQLGEVVDVLALTANSANTTVLQLGDALKFVAPVSAGLGVSLEATSAAIGVLSDNGLQASLAGTGLRRVLAELEAPSSTTLKIFKQLGVSASEVEVSQVGLTAALQALRDAGVETGEALQIFGQRGGPAFEVLSNSIPDIIELEKQLKNAEGTAQDIADTMDDNLNGALLASKSAIQGFILELGELGGQDFLQGLFEGLADGIRSSTANLEINLQVFSLWADVIEDAIDATGAFEGELNVLGEVGGEVGDKLLDAFIDIPGALVTGIKIATVEIASFIDRFNKNKNSGLSIFSSDEDIAQFELEFQAIEQARIDSISDILDVKKAQDDAFKERKKQIIAEREEREASRLATIEEAKALSAKAAAERLANQDQKKTGGLSKEIGQLLSLLDDEARILELTNNERKIESILKEAGITLNRELTDSEQQLVDATLHGNEVLATRNSIIDSIGNPLKSLSVELEALIQLQKEGEISSDQFNMRLREMQSIMLELQIASGDGTIFEAFITGLDRAVEEAQNPIAELTNLFEGFFNTTLDGISNLAAEAIVFGDDFAEGFGQLAEQAVADLIAGLIKLGLQMGINALIGETIGATAVAAGIGQAAALSTAYAPAAAFASLASFGANAAPAQAGIVSTVSLSTGLAVAGFQNGGEFVVGGAGGPDSQLVQFAATPGERVNIQTPGQMESDKNQAAPAPRQDNFKIINVLDKSIVGDFMASPAGTKVLINAIGKNSGAINQQLRN